MMQLVRGRGRFNGVASALGSSEFLSLPVLASLPAAVLIATFMYDVVAHQASVFGWLVLGLVPSLLVIAALVAFTKAVRPTGWTTPHPVVAVAVYFVAGLIRGAVADALSMLWDEQFQGTALLAREVGVVPRVIASALIVTVAMSGTCVLAFERRRHKRERSQLESRRIQLLVLSATMAERVAQARRELIAQTQEQLGPAMDRVRGRLLQLSQGDPGGTAIVDELASVVTTLVRPMSHSLGDPETSPVVAALSTPAPNERLRINEPIDIVTALSPTAVVLTTLVTVATSGASAFTGLVTPSGQLVVLTIVTSLTIWGLLTVVRLSWPTRHRVMPLGHALIYLTGIYLLVLGVLPAVAVAFRQYLEGPSNALHALALVGRTFLALVISLIVIIAAQRQSFERQLIAINAELAALVATLRRELWLIRRSMALTLHGPVQSALLSSAMLLSREDSTASDLDEARIRIERALQTIADTEVERPDLTGALASLTRLWSQSATITTTVEAQASHQLGNDPGLTAVVIEVVREATSNALRHGNAAHVNVEIGVQRDGGLWVHVTDDGNGLPVDPQPGLGSRTLAEVAVSWTRTSDPTGTHLAVCLGA